MWSKKVTFNMVSTLIVRMSYKKWLKFFCQHYFLKTSFLQFLFLSPKRKVMLWSMEEGIEEFHKLHYLGWFI